MSSRGGDFTNNDFLHFSSSDWSDYFKNLLIESTFEAQYYQTNAAKLRVNLEKNRYADVLPYDHSRVILNQDDLEDRIDSDYINANFIRIAHPITNDASSQYLRQYILTQGPLSKTASQFWLMVWQQNSKAIIMLNQIVEKGVQKCFPYFPRGYKAGDVEEHEYQDVHLVVRYLSEENFYFYIKRTFLVTHTKSEVSREIFHFHYLTWPDFGVPRSPGSFLNFMWAVRLSDALNHLVCGPAVIHCSAGIGRSGTFVIIDSTLAMVELTDSLESVDIRKLLQDVRHQRMGLIQSPEQLSFSYAAINIGCQILLENDKSQRKYLQFPMSETSSVTETLDDLAKLMNGTGTVSHANSDSRPGSVFSKSDQMPNLVSINENNMEIETMNPSKNSDTNAFYASTEERRRIRSLRQSKNQERIREIKKRMEEEKLHRWRHSFSVKLSVGAVVAGGIGIALYLFWPSGRK